MGAAGCAAAGRRRDRRRLGAVAADQLPSGHRGAIPSHRQAGTTHSAVPPGPPPGTPQPPDSVTINPATSRDRQIVEQATVLLQRHRELAEQRRAEVGSLNRSVPLDLTPCEQCRTGSLSSRPPSFILRRGGKCDVTLHMPVLERQARRARLPVQELTAIAVLHEQEGCLRHNGSTLPPFTAERRLARNLGHPQLFDLIFAQVVAGTRDWRILQQAVAIARDHGELAPQRWKQLRRRQLNQFGPLSIDVCRSCLRDAMGQASTGRLTDDIVGCAIKLDIARIEDTARTWALPLTGSLPPSWSMSRSTVSAIPTTVRPQRSTRSAGWPRSSATAA
jgi:hypothetical protein